MREIAITLLLLTGLCLSGRPCSGAEIKEEGHAKITPWSGYWWPHFQGLLLQPLAKYDQLTGRNAEAWERQTHPPGENVPRWHGYCHAWAASSLMEAEPCEARTVDTSGGQTSLTVGDQKGLLAVSHALDVANSYGDRFGDEAGSEDKQDLQPDVLWRLLKLYVKQQAVPLILDVEAGPEVWNYPVYAYRVETQPSGEGGLHTATLTLWMADDGVPPDFVGVKVRRQSYRFSVQLVNNSVVIGTGRWLGPSAEDHPDFAWYPFVAVPQNPEIDYPTVQHLLGANQLPVDVPTQPETESEPQDPNTQPPPTTPTDPDDLVGPNAEAAPGDAEMADVLVLSPLELVSLIAERKSSFGLDVTVDRFDGGQYQVGDDIHVRTSSKQTGYLYLLHIDSSGNVGLLFPQPGVDNRIAATETRLIPGPNDNFVVRASLPAGTARIKAVVTSKPLVLTGLLPAELAGVSQSSQQTRSDRTLAQEQDGADQDHQVARLQTFRWHPTQQQQIQRLLRDYQRSQQLPSEQTGDPDLNQVLGPFAQDEVAYYVGPGPEVQDRTQESEKLNQFLPR